MKGVDDLDVLRHRLADLEAGIEEAEGAELAALREEAESVEARIAALQNPVGPPVTGEVLDPETADEFKPASSELVVRPDEPESVFVVLDRHDEQMIIEEFQRRALKVMLYDFEQGGKRLVDLSYQGVNEGVRLINNTGKANIRVDHSAFGGRGYDTVIETADAGNGPEEFYVTTVYAVDDRTGYGQFGVSSEPKLMRLRNGKTKWDIHARTKALGKAQRNALKQHIPEQLRQTMIATFKQDPTALRQIQAGAGAVALAELPAPLVDAEAEALKAEARGVFEQVREVDRLAMLPAVYHAHLIRASSSHEALRTLVESLQQKLVEVKALAGATA